MLNSFIVFSLSDEELEEYVKEVERELLSTVEFSDIYGNPIYAWQKGEGYGRKQVLYCLCSISR